ncbi:MAG TPA: hypothetical protein VIU61_21985 [Kofleriaceae bacterium]
MSTALTTSGCKQLECADGTIERDGMCEPADVPVAGICGPFTELQGDRCVPMFPPTECDPSTTEADTDPTTGVTTCIGTGGVGNCTSDIACTTPAGASKQTICGRLYDFETNLPFRAGGDTDTAPCNASMPEASGPCALTIGAYDAIAFAMNPGTAVPLPTGGLYIDRCGRYKLTDIETNGTGPFIGLGVDDAGGMGPTGVTVTAAVATAKSGMTATRNVEAWIVKPSTAMMWATTGGPTLQTGVYAGVFRQHKVGNGDQFANQMGVTITKAGNTVTANDFYFQAALTDRTTVDPAATSTGANGTALVNNASVNDSVVWAGQGALGAGCRWEPHAAASLPGIVFIQVFRKIDILGMTCSD